MRIKLVVVAVYNVMCLVVWALAHVSKTVKDLVPRFSWNNFIEQRQKYTHGILYEIHTFP